MKPCCGGFWRCERKAQDIVRDGDLFWWENKEKMVTARQERKREKKELYTYSWADMRTCPCIGSQLVER